MSSYLHPDNTDLMKIAHENAENYINAEPFPNICFNNFFDPAQLEVILSEFPGLSKLDATQFKDPDSLMI